MAITTDQKLIVEAVIDTLGISVTLDLLALICHEKADHIAENWQDSGSATAWKRAANALTRASTGKDIEFVQKVYGPK